MIAAPHHTRGSSGRRRTVSVAWSTPSPIEVITTIVSANTSCSNAASAVGSGWSS
jgi:hypothetical protein